MPDGFGRTPEPGATAGRIVDGLNTDELGHDPMVTLLRVTVDAALADVVSDRFWQVGVRAVTETTLPDGRVEVSSSVGNDPDAIARTVETFDPAWDVRFDDVSTEPADTWKRHAEPTWYRPDMVIVPAWLPREELDTARLDAARMVTHIDPGSTFGLGDHPSTRSSMAMLAAAIERDAPTITGVLDVGCGTGVLAVLAAQSGIARVRAIDIAHAAVAATTTNAELNGVGGRIFVDTTPIADIVDTYDVVVANILAPVLVSMADDLQRVTAPGGSLVVSGLLASRHRHVLEALAPMRVVDSVVDDGWITIELRH